MAGAGSGAGAEIMDRGGAGAENQCCGAERNYLFSAPAPILTIISAPDPAPATAIYWHF